MVFFLFILSWMFESIILFNGACGFVGISNFHCFAFAATTNLLPQQYWNFFLRASYVFGFIDFVYLHLKSDFELSTYRICKLPYLRIVFFLRLVFNTDNVRCIFFALFSSNGNDMKLWSLFIVVSKFVDF